MKKLSIILMLSLFIAACNNTNTPDQSNTEATEINETPDTQAVTTEVAVIDLTGMHCEGCVNTITNALSGLEGVSDVKVSLEYEQAKLKFDPSKISTDEFKTAIEESGYGVGEIEVLKTENQSENPE